jgi:hypothetical protein
MAPSLLPEQQQSSVDHGQHGVHGLFSGVLRVFGHPVRVAAVSVPVLGRA